MKVGLWRAFRPQVAEQVSLPPLGLGSLASYGRQECWFADIQIYRDPEEIFELRPQLLGISSASENFFYATEIARKVKQELNIPIIIGGMHISALPQTLPEEFDVGVICEGEETFVELLKLLYYGRWDAPELHKIKGICFHHGSTVKVTEPRESLQELDQLPITRRDLLGDRWSVPFARESHLISSRGCPYRCSFCASRLWGGVRYFSPEYVVREIEYLRKEHDPEIIYFFDDLFIGHLGRFRKIASLIKERNLHQGVLFRAYARAELLDEPLVALLKELNVDFLDFGFEAHTARVLEYLNKTNASPEGNERAVELLGKMGFSIGANFILASPAEKLSDMETTYGFVDHYKEVLSRLSVSPLIPLPGTPVWDYALEKRLVSESMNWERLRTPRTREEMQEFPYLCENVSPEDFFRLYERFKRLEWEINLKGQIRLLERRVALKEIKLGQKQAQLDTIKGSRFFKLFWKLRHLWKK